MSIISSDRLESAATYISTSPTISKVSNDVKLELYALYKCITVSKNPQTQRPSLFDFTGRAKWDAWNNLGRQSDEPQPDLWRQRYLEIAKSLGWQEGIQQSDPVAGGSTPSKASNNELEKGDSHTSGGGGMGVVVSTMSQPPLDPRDHGTLHGFALLNDMKGLLKFLDAHSEMNLDFLDEYGYTALQLAADRGNTSVIEVLLDRGADSSIKDSDGVTALELAEVGGHEDVVKMIQRHGGNDTIR